MKHLSNRPSRWIYVLTALALVLGCLASTIIFGLRARWLPDALKEAYNLNGLTQVVVPGSAELALSRTGVYGVYYEYRGVVDGVEYVGSEIPPTLICSLTSNTVGTEILAVPDYVETNRYSTDGNQRVGVLAMSFKIDEPDTYLFSCQYPDGKTEPQVILAVGHNLFLELISIVTRAAGSVASGLTVLCGSALVAIAIFVVVAVRRHRPAT